MKKTKNENCRVTQDGGQFNPNPCIRRKFFIAYKNQSKWEVQKFFPLSPYFYKQYCRGVLQIVNCKTNIIAQRQENFLNKWSTEKRIATFSRRTFDRCFFFVIVFVGIWAREANWRRTTEGDRNTWKKVVRCLSSALADITHSWKNNNIRYRLKWAFLDYLPAYKSQKMLRSSRIALRCAKESHTPRAISSTTCAPLFGSLTSSYTSTKLSDFPLRTLDFSSSLLKAPMLFLRRLWASAAIESSLNASRLTVRERLGICLARFSWQSRGRSSSVLALHAQKIAPNGSHFFITRLQW